MGRPLVDLLAQVELQWAIYGDILGKKSPVFKAPHATAVSAVRWQRADETKTTATLQDMDDHFAISRLTEPWHATLPS
jgi:hypothetical protein